jgi:hypothetical protein
MLISQTERQKKEEIVKQRNVPTKRRRPINVRVTKEKKQDLTKSNYPI